MFCQCLQPTTLLRPAACPFAAVRHSHQSSLLSLDPSCGNIRWHWQEDPFLSRHLRTTGVLSRQRLNAFSRCGNRAANDRVAKVGDFLRNGVSRGLLPFMVSRGNVYLQFASSPLMFWSCYLGTMDQVFLYSNSFNFSMSL